MRSRQEARWARMFDFVGWEWEYEPVDLDGWLPDFWLPGQEVLVECKPALRPQDFEPAEYKAEQSGYKGRVVILGARWCECPGVWADLDGAPATANWLPWKFPSDSDPKWLAMGWRQAGNAVQWKKR